MGLLKSLILYVATKKVEEAIYRKQEEKSIPIEPIENESKKEKKPLLKSREEFFEIVFTICIISQILYGFVLIVLQVDSLSLSVFYRSYAMAALVSCVLLLIGVIAYGFYLIGFLPMVFFVLILGMCYLSLSSLDYGGSIWTGAWMNSAEKLVFSLLGIITIVSGFAYLCYCESKKTDEKKTAMNISEEETEKNRNLRKWI